VTSRIRVGLIFGGRSGEHEVSVISARSVAREMDCERFEVIPLAVDRGGRWADASTSAAVLAAGGTTPDTVGEFVGQQCIDPRLWNGEVEVVFPVLHGPYGEDGTVQGLCEMLDLPYVGCGVAAAAVTMDKVLTKRILQACGVPTPRFVTVAEEEWHNDPEACRKRCQTLPLPLFVKPARLGSSVGITKVKEWGVLGEAVERALVFDHLLIVEEGIDAREIEVAVLGEAPPVASVPGEVVPGHEFYDYADKYLDDACQLLAPAPLAEEVAAAARLLAVQAFQLLGCEGMARVDFLLRRSDGTLFVNELNSIPGFTPISMYPRLMGLSGFPYRRLLSRLVELAFERHARRQRHAAAARLPLAARTSASSTEADSAKPQRP